MRSGVFALLAKFEPVDALIGVGWLLLGASLVAEFGPWALVGYSGGTMIAVGLVVELNNSGRV